MVFKFFGNLINKQKQRVVLLVYQQSHLTHKIVSFAYLLRLNCMKSSLSNVLIDIFKVFKVAKVSEVRASINFSQPSY